MPILVPTKGTEITVVDFGKPVADQVNANTAAIAANAALLTGGAAGKCWYLDTAGMSGTLPNGANQYSRIWTFNVTIDATDLRPGLCMIMYASTYVPPTYAYGLCNGWDNVRVGVGVGGASGPGAMGPLSFAVSPTITVAGVHSIDMFFNTGSGTYNLGGSAMIGVLAVRK